MNSPSRRIMDALGGYAEQLRDAGEFEKAQEIDVLVETANRAGHEYPGDREACLREIYAAGKVTGRLPDWFLEELIDSA